LVHTLASLQLAAFGVLLQESVDSLQESSVQATPSLQFTAAPAWHVPETHCSAPLQNRPSEQSPLVMQLAQVSVPSSHTWPGQGSPPA